MRRTFAGPDIARNVAMNATSETSSVPSTASTIRTDSERLISGLYHTDIPLSAHGSNRHRPGPFELPPQMTEVHIERSLVRCGLALIQYRRQLIARDDPAHCPHEHLEDREFRRRQLDRHTAERDGAS